MRIVLPTALMITTACGLLGIPTHVGHCDDIALGTDVSTLPVTSRPPQALVAPNRGSSGPCSLPDGGVTTSQHTCSIEVRAPYGGTCHDSGGEGGTWVCAIWVGPDGKVSGVGTDCYN